MTQPADKATPRELEVPCSACNAKPGERCSNLIDASKFREFSHPPRVQLARQGAKT